MERINLNDLFDRRLTFPDMSASRRLSRMVGVDEPKLRLSKILGILINTDGPRKWAERFHKGANTLLEYVERRPPLVILAGDVGTGKTELAENIGDAVARQEHLEIMLYPVSLAARGSGRVGEMTQLVTAAFDHVLEAAQKLRRSSGKAAGGIILLVDEADALTQSREEGQMHHEDRAGVNAFIRGVDRLAEQHVPVAVILCTNRLSAIDPAVRRRAADVFTFGRPSDVQRRAVIEGPLTEAGFNAVQIDKIVTATGPRSKEEPGFTFSDLTQRFLPTLVLDAYPDRAITFERAMAIAGSINPTPQFRDAAGNMRS